MDTIYVLEESCLKEEVIPFIKNELDPLVNAMMGDFHLDVSYSKDEGLNVQYLNNYGVRENNKGRRKAKETTDKTEKPKADTVQYDTLKSVFDVKKKQASTLIVYKEDNTVIEEATSALTLCETIKEIGPEKVYNLFIPLDGMYLVMKTSNSIVRSDMHYVGDGYYVNTHSNTQTKKRHLERIFISLQLNWRVEIV